LLITNSADLIFMVYILPVYERCCLVFFDVV
jgi:hypothetical protein